MFKAMRSLCLNGNSEIAKFDKIDNFAQVCSSYRIQIHFLFFHHLHLLFSFIKVLPLSRHHVWQR